MTTRNLFIWGSGIILLTASACNENSFTQIVEIDIPEHESLPTLGFDLREGDSTAYVLASKSRGILDQENFPPISNAQIKLSRNGILLTNNFTLDPGNEVYFAQLPAPVDGVGATYRIDIDVPGVGAAFAEQVMPAKPNVTEVVYTPLGAINADGERVDEIKVTIQDPAGESNYYALELLISYFVLGPDGDTLDIQTYSYYLDTNDPVLNPGTPYSLVFSDDAFDGGSYVARVNTSELYDNPEGFTEIRVYQLTRDAFLYARSLSQYWNSEGNPFAEPVTVHGNVQGGYGAFILSNYRDFRIR